MFDTMVFTKALGALCGALLIFLLASWVSGSLYVPGSRNLPPAFVEGLPDPDADPADTALAAAPVADLPLPEAFRMADAAAGARVWSQCRACHVADEARNGVGPYLQNVVGRDIAAVDGFRYSGALPADEVWTVENLYVYLENPRGWAPGTSMAFNGLRAQSDRVNVIAYLIDNSPEFDPATDPVLSAMDEAALEPEEAPEEAVADAPAEEVIEDETVAEAPAEEAVEEEAVAEAPAEGAVEEEPVAEAPAEEAVEEDAVEAPVEDAVEEDVVEAPVEEAVEEEAVAEAPADEAPAEDAVAAEAVTEDEMAEEAVAEEAVEDEATEEAVADMSAFAQMVAAGDAAAGARVWNQCRACHIADSETNRVGPHLVDIVGRQSNSIEGFRYSGRLPDVVWTLDELDLYLENPRTYAPGTSMAFNGLRSQQDRANVLAYIQSLN